MKSIRKQLAIALFIFSISIPFSTIGQSEPPPPPGGHGETGDQPAGGGVPIGGGLFVLLSLGAVYGGRKTYQLFQSEKS